MQILAESPRAFNGANENAQGIKPAFSASGVPTYTVRSRTTSEGNRAHTVKTKSAAFAIAVYGAALDFDDAPEDGCDEQDGAEHVVYFYADDVQCDAVVDAALKALKRGRA